MARQTQYITATLTTANMHTAFDAAMANVGWTKIDTNGNSVVYSVTAPSPRNSAVNETKIVRIDCADEAGNMVTRTYISEAWDTTNKIGTNERLLGIVHSIPTTTNAVLILAGSAAHLAFLFKSGTTYTQPTIIANIDPYKRADGTVVNTNGEDGTYPTWGGIQSYEGHLYYVSPYTYYSGVSFRVCRGPYTNKDFQLVGDSLFAQVRSGVNALKLSSTMFSPQPPEDFGGGVTDYPHFAKRASLYIASSYTQNYSTQSAYEDAHPAMPDNTTGVSRGYLSTNDTILFVRNTQGGIEDSVTIGANTYMVFHKNNNHSGVFDILIKE